MGYLGCILFLLIFWVIRPKNFNALMARFNDVLQWGQSWAPFSYIVLLLVLVAPVIAMKIMRSWPETEEPENPMAKYRNADDVIVED